MEKDVLRKCQPPWSYSTEKTEYDRTGWFQLLAFRVWTALDVCKAAVTLQATLLLRQKIRLINQMSDAIKTTLLRTSRIILMELK